MVTVVDTIIVFIKPLDIKSARNKRMEKIINPIATKLVKNRHVDEEGMVKDRKGSKEYQSFVRQDRISDTYDKETSNLEING
ncbi:MAG: hypothetical protein P0116_00915 [Candidatus Nitrosocosmicus sp.]|nr:hypothetical protein [Candidatus Nitrosocosmicus sp.]